MGNRVVIYKQKVEDNLKESYKHLDRLDGAFAELSNSFKFPIDKHSFEEMTSSTQSLAYRDQIIYRFSKLQDCMGAKLFKLVLLSQGENVNKPFLDILNQLEKINIIDVDEWFEIRDLRNEIAYDYEDNDLEAIEILNTIYKLKGEVK
jgi:uncharacterized protein YkuJ